MFLMSYVSCLVGNLTNQIPVQSSPKHVLWVLFPPVHFYITPSGTGEIAVVADITTPMHISLVHHKLLLHFELLVTFVTWIDS